MARQNSRDDVFPTVLLLADCRFAVVGSEVHDSLCLPMSWYDHFEDDNSNVHTRHVFVEVCVQLYCQLHLILKAAKDVWNVEPYSFWPLSVSDEADSIAGAEIQDEARSAIETSLSKLGVEILMT